MVYMYHSFLIHSSADGHLGCFHVLKAIPLKFNHQEGQGLCLPLPPVSVGGTEAWLQ